MAGIGPIDTDRRGLLKRAHYSTVQSVPRNELEIFLSLCVGRVLYRERNRSLYFVDSPALSITDIVHAVFRGLEQTPQIRQLYMDQHKLLKAAYCLRLTDQQKKLLMVALALNGIKILYQE